MTDEAQEAVEFGRFRLLPRRRELHADGVAVALGSRAFDILVVLTDARGALVTKDEILSRVWPGTVVEENNLVVQISRLRKALGEHGDFIRTVSGRGYQFVAEIHHSAAPSSNLQTPVSSLVGRELELAEGSDLPAGVIDIGGASSPLGRRSGHRRDWRFLASGLARSLVAPFSSVLHLRTQASPRPRSIAVLP